MIDPEIELTRVLILVLVEHALGVEGRVHLRYES